MGDRELGDPDTVLFHEGTNDLRRSGNLNYVMGEVYSLVAAAKSTFPYCTTVLTDTTVHERLWDLLS